MAVAQRPAPMIVVAEILAAALVAVEVVVLAAAVVSRYGLNSPLVGADEFATVMFLWLAMAGAVVALHRGQHMRLTFLVNRLASGWRSRMETLVAAATVAFLLIILPYAVAYTASTWSQRTPALHLPVSLQGAAIVLGIAAMLALSVATLRRQTTWSGFAIALGALAAAATGLWLARSVLVAIDNYNLVVFFVAILGFCIALGMPIAFAFGIATFGYLSFITTVPLTIVINRMHEGMSDFVLLSIPLFIFLGALMALNGLARALVDVMIALLGHVRSGLSYVLVGGMYLVSGISGSKVADMAAIAPILFPEMRRRGARDGEIIALLSASGAMAETIPPSIILISIGVVAGVSIAKLFAGGLMPAAVGAVALAAVIFVRSRADPRPAVPRAGAAQIGRLLVVAAPALALPVLIRAAVVNGIATATEVATVGILYSLLCGAFVYREFSWRRMYPALVNTAALSGVILLIIGMANAMAWALTQSGFSTDLADVMTRVPGGRIGFLAVSIVLFAGLGSILEGFPAIVLLGPLLFPIARDLGIHEVQYAMLVVFSMSLGLFAPPFGIGFYSACVIGEVSPDEAMRHIWVYIGALAVAVLLVAAIPWISIGFL